MGPSPADPRNLAPERSRDAVGARVRDAMPLSRATAVTIPSRGPSARVGDRPDRTAAAPGVSDVQVRHRGVATRARSHGTPRDSTLRCSSVLIVEDDEAIRDILKMTLELEGYSVATAENGRDGLALLPTMPRPCLILLDLMMPVMDGWAFANALKGDATLSAIPIVVVTAFEDKGKTMREAHSVIGKPVDIDLLLKTVKTHCELAG